MSTPRRFFPFSSSFAFSSLVALASLATVACGPQWVVIRQATPDPFVHHPQFKVEPLHFEQTRVGEKPEAEYAAGKQPDQQQSWTEDKQGMNERFSVALATSIDGLQINGVADAPTIRPIVTFIEPGFYAGVAAAATEVNLTVQILTPNGEVADEIAMHARVPAGLMNPSAGNRVRQAANELGKITAKYLKTRVSPDGK
jgi:hypothetical protein